MPQRAAREWTALAIVLLAGLAGCAEPEEPEGIERSIDLVPNDVDQTARGSDEYWMVWIHGNETDERRNQAVCDQAPPDYRIHRGNESVVYDNSSYDFQPEEVSVLLAFDHQDESSQCPEVHRLVANPEDDHSQAMGEYGNLTLTVRADGTLVVDDERVPLGQTARVTYNGTPPDPDKLHVNGTFEVVNLGDWNERGLQPEDDWG